MPMGSSGSIMRKITLGLAVALFAVWSSFAATAAESTTAKFADLYAKAKEEGSVSIYSAFPAKQIEDFYITPFEAAFPGIEVENNAVGSPAAIIQAFTTESKAGVHKADLLYINTTQANDLAEEGLLATYDAVSAQDIADPGLRNQEGYWYGTVVRLAAPNVNTRQLDEALYPVDWLDFANPRPEWEGKIGILDAKSVGLQYSVLFALQEKYGAQKLDDILNGLKRANAKFYANNGQLTAAVESGEISIAFANGDPFTVPSIRRGAPVAWIVPKSGIVRYPVPMVISANAPHPNAARLWLEFFLSREGQAAIAKGPAFPARADTPVGDGYPTDLSTFLTVDQVKAMEEKDAILARWSAIFGR